MNTIRINLDYPVDFVVFTRIHPKIDVLVAPKDAPEFFEQAQRDGVSYRVTSVIFADGKSTCAKSWSIWDAEEGVHRLSHVGLGARGDLAAFLTEYEPFGLYPDWPAAA
jgi:hypothetical protein